jgi:hypothetical protein
MDARFCDEFSHGFGWAEPGFLERTSHALVAGGGVWLIDPLAAPGVEERVGAAGRPSGVIQLLDRHTRDCATLAEQLGIPLHVVPFRGVESAPFSFLRILRVPGWKEAALWWAETRVVVFADALGTARYFRAAGERLGVHPLLRLRPPRAAARGVTPRHVLCGHGEGIHGEEAAVLLDEALTTSRRRIPRWLGSQLRGKR